MGAARGVRCALAGSAPAAGDAGPASPAEAVTRPATSGIGGWRAPLLLLAVYIGLAVLLLARGLFGGRGSFPGSDTDPAIFPFPASRFATPAFFTDGSAGRLSRPGSVLMTPYLGVEPLVWQAVSGMSFRTPLGLVFTPGPGGPHWSAPDDPLGTELEALGDGARPALSAALRQACLGDLDADRVSSIVVVWYGVT